MSKPIFVEVVNPKSQKMLVNVQDIIEIRPYKKFTYLTLRSTSESGGSSNFLMDLEYEKAKDFFKDLIDIR